MGTSMGELYPGQNGAFPASYLLVLTLKSTSTPTLPRSNQQDKRLDRDASPASQHP